MYRYLISFVFQPSKHPDGKHMHGNRVVERSFPLDEAGVREFEAQVNAEREFEFEDHAILVTGVFPLS